MACAWRNFKIIFSRPLFIIIFRPKILFFVTYSILTGQTKVEFFIYWVLNGFLLLISLLPLYFRTFLRTCLWVINSWGSWITQGSFRTYLSPDCSSYCHSTLESLICKRVRWHYNFFKKNLQNSRKTSHSTSFSVRSRFEFQVGPSKLKRKYTYS